MVWQRNDTDHPDRLRDHATATGPPRQATGPPRSGTGVGVGMLRGIQKFDQKGS